MNTEERLRELMEERGLNMYSLAKRSNLSWNTVKNIFSQKSKPTLTTLEMLCDGLGITLAQFFDTTDALVSFDKQPAASPEPMEPPYRSGETIDSNPHGVYAGPKGFLKAKKPYVKSGGMQRDPMEFGRRSPALFATAA